MTPAPAGSAPLRVLVVDDHPINLELARFVLEAAGMVVEQAADGASALRVVEHFDPQVVLMDIQLPDVDGLEVMRRLRQRLSPRTPAFVAFTALAMTGDEARLLAAGCDGYLSKPIDVSRFAAQVRAYASGRG